MKNFTTKTLTTLTLVALTQTISATTLDVTKFSSVWQELNKNNTVNQEHLSNYIGSLLKDNTIIAYEECTPVLNVTKFSSLWNEVHTNNNKSVHLTQALNSLGNEQICTTAV